MFQCFETPEMGPGIFTFSEFVSILFRNVSKQLKLDFSRACFNFVSKHFETNETFGLSRFSSCFSPFQFFPYIIPCFSVSKHQKWGLVFSLFPELVSILFRNISKQLKHLIFFLFQSVSVFSLYNPLFQCFETPEMGPGIFTFSRACFNFVSKQLKRLDLVNFLPVSVHFNFFPL